MQSRVYETVWCPSVRLSVCPSMGRQQQTCCCCEPGSLISIVCCSTHTHTHDRLTAFGPELPGWAGTRRNTHQHTHPDHRTSFINFLHLQRSIASSWFSLRAWQSSLTTSVRVLFGLPLGLGPDIDIALVFFSFQLSPPYGNLPLLHSPCISVAAAAAGSATLSAYIDSWTQTSLLTYCRFGRGRRNAVCSSFCLLSSPF